MKNYSENFLDIYIIILLWFLSFISDFIWIWELQFIFWLSLLISICYSFKTRYLKKVYKNQESFKRFNLKIFIFYIIFFWIWVLFKFLDLGNEFLEKLYIIFYIFLYFWLFFIILNEWKNKFYYLLLFISFILITFLKQIEILWNCSDFCWFEAIIFSIISFFVLSFVFIMKKFEK